MPRSSVRTLVAAFAGAGLAITASHIDADADADAVDAQASDQPRCVYVNSYHRGYRWSDRIETELRSTLGARCRLVSVYMDTKRRRDAPSMVAAGESALAVIDDIEPDIVITSDDNAAKYLIVPHLHDRSLPVVFSGINWTVEEYDFPRETVTGMVEVAPLDPMIRQAIATVGGARRAAYVAANTLSEQKNFQRLNEVATRVGVELFALHSDSMSGWENALTIAQQFDFVILGASSGIDDWDEMRAVAYVHGVARRFSVTDVEWMMPLTVLGYTKLAEEQGEWSGEAALAILDGVSPAAIPLVTNRRFDIWVNERLLDATGLTLSRSLLRQAKRVD